MPNQSTIPRDMEVRPVRIHGIKMYPVYSSNLLAVGYEDSKLIVLFRSGQVYSYAPVPPQVYKDFFSKESVGSYFSREIRDRYPATRLTTQNEDHSQLFRQEIRRIFG